MIRNIVRFLTVISALMVIVTPSGFTMGVPLFKVLLNTGFWCIMTRGFYRLEDRI